MHTLLLAVVLQLPAQPTAAPASSFAWDQGALDLATAQAQTYRHYDDGSGVGAVFPTVVCSGAASPFQCQAPIPAYTPGAHTVTVTAGNEAGESAPSNVVAFKFVVTPPAPANVRIK